MLPFEESKKILNQFGHQYTDEEVKIIREFVATLVEIDYQLFMRQQKESLKKTAKPIQLNPNYYEKKSDTLHKSEYRRTG